MLRVLSFCHFLCPQLLVYHTEGTSCFLTKYVALPGTSVAKGIRERDVKVLQVFE